MAPYAAFAQKVFPNWNGLLLYDSAGELIWSGAALFEHRNVFDFRVVIYAGKNVLSLICPDLEHGEGVLLDNHYEIQKALDLRGDHQRLNMHDFTILDGGATALTLTDVPGPATEEQSRTIGFDGKCHVGWEGFKELRVKENAVPFEWDSRDWISLDECTVTPSPSPHDIWTPSVAFPISIGI